MEGSRSSQLYYGVHKNEVNIKYWKNIGVNCDKIYNNISLVSFLIGNWNCKINIEYVIYVYNMLKNLSSYKYCPSCP